MAGYHELLAVEWEDNAAATFRLNFPEVPLYHGDIAKLSVAKCLEMIGLNPGELDVFDGSPPCQGFSTAGKRDMNDERNQLFREYVRLLRGLQPRAFVMENVSGMVKGKMKLVFAEILRELKASGYTVKARVLNAMYYGVPQSRQRMIFVGTREDLAVSPGHPQATGRPLPFQKTGSPASSDWLTPSELAAMRSHAAKQQAKGNGFCAYFVKDGVPSPTLSKSFSRRGGSSLQVVSDCGRFRLMTSGERSVTASFPLQFKFAGTTKDKWERTGNSVPPLFMRAIAKHVASLLAK